MMEYHSYTSPSSSSSASLLHSLGLLALRFAIGVPMIYYQGWHQSFRAWTFIWEKKSWSLVTQFEELNYPTPEGLAISLTVLFLLLPLALITGVYTRICALLFLIMVIFLLPTPIEFSGNLNSQTLLLYAGMAFTLILAGAGQISLDQLLTKRKIY